MLAALSFVHGQGIIHRNLQPQNVLYNDTKDFVLGDFASASLANPPPCERLESGASAEYSSPEMHKSQPQTPTTDIWSLGMMCLMMLNMQFIPPGSGAVEGMRETIWHQSMAEIARLSGRPELGMMIRIPADERSTADKLLEYLGNNPSIKTESWPVSADLAEYFRHTQSEGGVPDDLQLVPAQSEEDCGGLSREDLLEICLKDRASTCKMVLSTRPARTAEMHIPPVPLSQIRPLRFTGISSLYKSARSGMRGPSTLAVKLPRTSSHVTAKATRAAVQQPPLPPTRSQRETVASSASTVLPPSDLGGTGAAPGPKEASRQQQTKSQEAIETLAVANTAANSSGLPVDAGARGRPSASIETLPPRPTKSGAKKSLTLKATTPPAGRTSNAEEFLDLTKSLSSCPTDSAKTAETPDSSAISTPRPAAIKRNAPSSGSSITSSPRAKEFDESATLLDSITTSSQRPTRPRGGMEASSPATPSSSRPKGSRNGITSSDAKADPTLRPMQRKDMPATCLRLGEYHLKPEEDEGGWQQFNQKSRQKVHRSPPQPPAQPRQITPDRQSSAHPSAEARVKPFQMAAGEDLRHKTHDGGSPLIKNGLRHNATQSRGSFAPAENPIANTIQLNEHFFPAERPSIREAAAESGVKMAPHSQPTLFRQRAAPSDPFQARNAPSRRKGSQGRAGSSRVIRTARTSVTPSSWPTGSRQRASESGATTVPNPTQAQRRVGSSSTTAKAPLSYSVGPIPGEKSSSPVPARQLQLPRESDCTMVPLGPAEVPEQRSTGDVEGKAEGSSSSADSLQESLSAIKARRARELLWDLQVLRAKQMAAAKSERLLEGSQSQNSGRRTGSSRDLNDIQSRSRPDLGSQRLSPHAPEFYPQTWSGRGRAMETRVRK